MLATGSDVSGFDNQCVSSGGSNYSDWSTPSNRSRVRAVDMNGDGMADLVFGPGANGEWLVAQSTGSGFVNGGGAGLQGFLGAPWDDASSQIRIRALDVNG